MQNVLITHEDLVRDEMNAPIFTKDADDFAAYMGYVLERACAMELTFETRARKIISLILAAIQRLAVIGVDEEDFDSEEIISKNYLYVVSLYLEKMSVFEAWKRLDLISTDTDANDFVKEARSAFLEVVIHAEKRLEGIYPKVKSLNISYISEYYIEMLKFIKAMHAFDKVGNTLVLGMFHRKMLDFGAYTCLKEPYSSDESIDKYISEYAKAFSIEVELYALVGGNSVHSFRKQEENTLFLRREKEMVALDEKYQGKLDLLYKEWAKGNVPSNAYLKDRERVEQEWDEASKHLEVIHQKMRKDESEAATSYTSLFDIIKEYAILKMAEKGEIVYPETTAERSKALMSLDFSKALDEFVSGNIEKLSEEQKCYLMEVRRKEEA